MLKKQTNNTNIEIKMQKIYCYFSVDHHFRYRGYIYLRIFYLVFHFISFISRLIFHNDRVTNKQQKTILVRQLDFVVIVIACCCCCCRIRENDKLPEKNEEKENFFHLKYRNIFLFPDVVIYGFCFFFIPSFFPFYLMIFVNAWIFLSLF